MKVKTSELTGAALDWAVAKAVYGDAKYLLKPMMSKVPYVFMTKEDGREIRVSYSTNWAHSGPLIQSNLYRVEELGYDLWEAEAVGAKPQRGQSALIAICRAVVASKIGEEVDIPDSLL